MSVFTPVSESTLAHWLKNYAIGQLVSFEGIAAGVQNSNFFVTTTLGRYVLTLFEQIPRAQLPYYLHLMAHLARHGLPVPAPIANRDNEYLATLSDRPAVLVSRLSGHSITQPTHAHCKRIGAMLAGLHLAGLSYGRKQDNLRGASWRAQTALALAPLLPADERALLEDEMRAQHAHDWQALPQGAIHADLFRDNVLWQDGWISGVIDFYFAGYDTLLLDVAITLNDWCSQPDGQLDLAASQTFLEAYANERAFTPAEQALWPMVLRAAALRFWLSRAQDAYSPRQGEMVLIKDPTEFRQQLLARRAFAPTLPTSSNP